MNRQKSRKPPLHNYARYSAIAFEMLAIILLGVFVGLKLDEWLNWYPPLLTVLMSLASVIIAIYLVTKDLIKKQ